MDQLGPNALGETLEPGRVADCYLGLLLPPQPAGGNRRVRYRGLVRNQLGLTLRIAAINLRRLVTLGLAHNRTGWVLAEQGR